MKEKVLAVAIIAAMFVLAMMKIMALANIAMM